MGFGATNASGEWSVEETGAVQAALGLALPATDPARRAAAGAAAIERWLDQVAQSLGYNNFITATSYASSAVDLWRRQAVALAALRDVVWQAAIALLAEPARRPTSKGALIALLPQPEIPTS